VIGGESEDKDCDEDTTLNTRFRYSQATCGSRRQCSKDNNWFIDLSQVDAGNVWIHSCTSWTLKVSGSADRLQLFNSKSLEVYTNDLHNDYNVN